MSAGLRSMTGFGRGEASVGRVRVEVEAKSVNHRFVDVAVRLPRELSAEEGRVGQRVREHVARGRVDLTVRRDVAGGAAEVVTDRALFEQLLAASDELLGDRAAAGRDARALWALAQPGVVSTRAVVVEPDDEAAALLAALEQALVALTAMRAVEGAALRTELVSTLADVRSRVAAVAAGVVDLRTRLVARLEARVGALLGTAVEPWRLVQEAALLADRADVAEELARLGSHLDQLDGLLAGEGPVGRKLEFLLQEVGREVNTIASKTVDASVAHDVVEIKTLVERLREQSANVE